MNSSPVQRMFGRRTRTQLPTAEVLLKPQSTDTRETRDQILKRKAKQTYHYNQHAKELPTLLEGETVRVAPQPGNRSQKWFKAVVQDQTDVRSYNVRTQDGGMFRRNRRHLRSSKEPLYPFERNEPEISPSPQPQRVTSANSRTLSGKNKASSRPVKDKNGETITDEAKERARWAEHFQEILKRPSPQVPPDIPPAANQLAVSINPPTKAEVSKAIKSLKSGKAAGPDGIPPEALKADVQTSTEMIHPLLMKIWENEQIPVEWKKG
ncbi:uncharacterized protein [Montipora foliosa]|uniref:uncharacterized protein n=1 Tax=Montipora foliosa TaxID=591990 RepID=UPI0035F14360